MDKEKALNNYQRNLLRQGHSAIAPLAKRGIADTINFAVQAVIKNSPIMVQQQDSGQKEHPSLMSTGAPINIRSLEWKDTIQGEGRNVNREQYKNKNKCLLQFTLKKKLTKKLQNIPKPKPSSGTFKPNDPKHRLKSNLKSVFRFRPY